METTCARPVFGRLCNPFRVVITIDPYPGLLRESHPALRYATPLGLGEDYLNSTTTALMVVFPTFLAECFWAGRKKVSPGLPFIVIAFLPCSVI